MMSVSLSPEKHPTLPAPGLEDGWTLTLAEASQALGPSDPAPLLGTTGLPLPLPAPTLPQTLNELLPPLCGIHCPVHLTVTAGFIPRFYILMSEPLASALEPLFTAAIHQVPMAMPVLGTLCTRRPGPLLIFRRAPPESQHGFSL